MRLGEKCGTTLSGCARLLTFVDDDSFIRRQFQRFVELEDSLQLLHKFQKNKEREPEQQTHKVEIMINKQNCRIKLKGR